MYNINVKDIVLATGGKLLCGDENTVVKDICIDSRTVKEGDLFVPIIGEKVDSHIFIENVMDTAAATLTSRHSGVVISDKPYIQVYDTQKALQDIGIYIRNKKNIPIVGITGSVGKTTTREMVATALSGSSKVYQTEKNFNSQIGVPIVLSRIEEDAEIAVLEMGMSLEGQMDNLSRIVRPDICVVTVIGVAHIEFLGTRENIRKEKLSIINHMNKDGVIFLNGDDDMLAEVKDSLPVKTLYYGTSEWCDYQAKNIRVENYQTIYDYVHGEKTVTVKLNAMGKHNVLNSLAGMAVAEYVGNDLEKAAAKFGEFKGMRQVIIDVPDKYTIIDDTYNASPDSMKASINVLNDMDVKGRRVAVLGDMKELGNNSVEYHRQIGEFICEKNVDILVTVGDLAKEIADAVKNEKTSIVCNSFIDCAEAALYLMSELKKEDVVLLKASNSMNFGSIVKQINM